MNLSASRKIKLTPYLFIAPTILIIGLFNIYPLAMSFYYSFFEWNGFGQAVFVGTYNFITIFHDDDLIHSIPNLLIYMLGSCIKMIFPILTAVLIFHVKSGKMGYLFKVLFVVPIIVPMVVWILLWQDFLSSDGLVNQILRELGMGGIIRDWLGDPDTALYSLLLIGNSGSYAGFPFVSPLALLIILAGLLTISTDLFDAARIDGSNAVQRFLHLELPCILPQLLVVLTLSMIASAQDFGMFLILTKGGPANSTMIPALYMYLQGLSYSKIGYANAIGMILFAFLFVLSYVNRKLQRMGG